MQIWQAIILGIVQGVTEFLPVSSSGHLLLFEQMLNVNTESSELFLGIMLHAGTLVAVLCLYFKKCIAICKQKKGILFLIVATIPAALAGFFLADYIDKLIQGRMALAITFLISALLLAVAEFVQKRQKKQQMYVGLKGSICMGLGQAIAIFPGISRSGATYALGVCSGLEKQTALDFSFIMSIPIILGAIVNELVKVWTGKAVMAMQIPLFSLLVGMLTAVIFGILSIKLYKKIVLAGKFKYFSIYLFILSTLLFLFPIV